MHEKHQFPSGGMRAQSCRGWRRVHDSDGAGEPRRADIGSYRHCQPDWPARSRSSPWRPPSPSTPGISPIGGRCPCSSRSARLSQTPRSTRHTIRARTQKLCSPPSARSSFPWPCLIRRLAGVLTDSQKIAIENRAQDLRALPGEHSQAHAAGHRSCTVLTRRARLRPRRSNFQTTSNVALP